MTFTSDELLRRLRELHAGIVVHRYLVGFSGGLDSTVLLHALAETRGQHGTPIVAVHVNHGLQEDALQWEEHCRRNAEKLEVEFLTCKVDVVDTRGVGPEAAAREARYAAMCALMRDNDVILSAHHQEDQAETLLLNLMRGSGLAGLAGIGASQAFGSGTLVRPMLGISRQAIERYARDCALDWIDDPSNLDLRFDRNYLRQEVVPVLRKRWPAASARLGHSAELAAESARLQDELAHIDLLTVVAPGETERPLRLHIPAIGRLVAERQRNVLRYAIKRCGLPQAPSSCLAQLQRELLPARVDARPLVRWSGAELRRYRQTLYLLETPASPVETNACRAASVLYADGREVDLGPSLGRVQLAGGASVGIAAELAREGLQLRFRQGGEKIRPFKLGATRPLKKLLQEKGVVPWMRHKLPLLYSGETLVAVADLWIAAECAQEGGFAVQWSDKPPIF